MVATLDRVLGITKVCEVVGLHRTTIYRHVLAGVFPPPIKAGRSNRWPEGDILAWRAGRRDWKRDTADADE